MYGLRFLDSILLEIFGEIYTAVTAKTHDLKLGLLIMEPRII